MRTILFIASLISLTNLCYGQKYRPRWLTGNDIPNLIIDHKYAIYGKSKAVRVLDPVDDTINYKRIIADIYRDTAGSVFKLTEEGRPYNDSHDTSICYEFYKDFTDFIDLKTYKKLQYWFFINRDTVCFWQPTTSGDNPMEIHDADPQTFVPLDQCAAKDKSHVFCFDGSFEIIEGADPKTIKILYTKSKKGYLVDDKNVFFGPKRIEGADPKTFKLLNQEKVDAEDKNRRYFDGEVVK